MSIGVEADLPSLFEFIRNGMNVKQSKERNGLPITRIETISHGEVDAQRVGYAGLTVSDAEKWLLKEGDILFSHINSVDHIGKCALFEGGYDLVHGMNLLCFRPKVDRVDPNFLKWFFKSDRFRSQIMPFVNKAVNQASISIGNLSSLRIKVPTLEVQKRIAAILDQADELRLKRQRAIDRLGQLGQAIFHEMFGEWDREGVQVPTVQLGDHLDFLTSGSRGWAKYYRETGDIFLRIQNVKRDALDLSDVAFVDPPASAEAKRTLVQAGDVLLSITADLGRTAVVPDDLGDAYINQHLAIIRTKAFNPRFLSAALSSPSGQRGILKRNREGVKAGLNFDDVRSVSIPDVPMEVQNTFASQMQNGDALKHSQICALEVANDLLASLQHRAFQGEL